MPKKKKKDIMTASDLPMYYVYTIAVMTPEDNVYVNRMQISNVVYHVMLSFPIKLFHDEIDSS
jgi:hypothetical protein